MSAYSGSVQEARADYFTYGGMPLVLTRKTDEEKSKYHLQQTDNLRIYSNINDIRTVIEVIHFIAEATVEFIKKSRYTSGRKEQGGMSK